MVPVDQNGINQMQSILDAMNGKSGALRNNDMGINPNAPATALIDESANVDAMKRVLQNFYGVTENLIDSSKTDSTLRTAMKTVETNTGSKIGEWEIYVREENKRKFYDVVSESNGVTIASDLTLYEAAYGIAKSLADGQPITCRIVREILQAEGDYAFHLTDAIHHKHNLSKKLVESRRAILEDRFDVAKQKARLARQRVMDLVKPPF